MSATSTIPAPPMPSAAIALDLSGHQKGIDVAALLSDFGPLWIACKFTEAQGFIDEESLKILDQIVEVSNDIFVSGYHFAWANRPAKAQAQNFLRIDRHDLINGRPVVDIEGVYDVTKHAIVDVPEVGPVKALATYRELVDEIEQGCGLEAIVYTSPGFISTFFSTLGESVDAQFLASRSLWVAHYGVSAPAVPLFWRLAGRSPCAWQDDGGQRTRSREGKPIDHSFIFNADELMGRRLPIFPTASPIELDPRGEPIALDQFLDLLARPGGQALP